MIVIEQRYKHSVIKQVTELKKMMAMAVTQVEIIVLIALELLIIGIILREVAGL